MLGNPSAPTNPGGTGAPNLLARIFGAGGMPTAGGGSGAPGVGGIGLSQILQLLSALGSAGYGTKELEAIQTLFQNQQRAAANAMNASKISERGAAATLPINRELAYTVDQAADANSANAGMAQSPGAVAAARAQALAPFAQQNLEMGMENARFGFPFQWQTQPPNYLSVLGQLNQLGLGSGGGGTFSLPAGTF